MNPTHWSQLDTPALLVDLDRLESNVTRMAERARRAKVRLRPHFKTHKCVEIAKLQRAAGATGMTVASLDEAEVLIDAGFDDLLIATQLVSSTKLIRAVELAGRAKLSVGVDDRTVVDAISAAARHARVEIGVSIEVDSGLARCGVAPTDVEPIAESAAAAPNVRLDGVFTHGGHAYRGPDRGGVERAHADELDAIAVAGRVCEAVQVSGIERSIGSTPTVLAGTEYGTATEIRPGNYVFVDAMQVALGVADPATCALSVATTVISRPAPNRAVIDAGAKTLALDRGGHGFDAITDHGRPIDGPGFVRALSEEHGIMEVPPESTYRVGDAIRIVPNHACPVVNLGRTLSGIRNDLLERIMTIDAAGATR